jgi:site-specific DNA-cytosine methylase
MAHAPTRAIVEKFCELLEQGLWEIVVMESLVHFYNGTEAWRLIRRTAKAAGYALVAIETFVAREVGLPTGRERRIAAFSRVGRGKYDLAEVWRELAGLEKAGALSLKECLFGYTATKEQRSYGVTAAMLQTQREISEKKQARLAEALAKAKLTVEAAQKAGTYCVDLARSTEWTRVSTGAPTITAGHTRKSLWLPHLGRYARGVTRPGGVAAGG